MKKIFYPLLCLFLFSCEDDANIQFRIKNELGESISRCYLGSLIRKGSNSYASKSYKNRWNNIADGVTTDYRKVKGKFWGYSNCSLEFYGDNAKYPHSSRTNAIQESIDLLGLSLVKDSIKHPYTNEFIKKDRLPDGKYTLIIKGFDPKIAQTIIVEVVKDE